MDEHDDDLEPSVQEDAEQETEAFPETEEDFADIEDGEEADGAARHPDAEAGDDVLPLDRDRSEL